MNNPIVKIVRVLLMLVWSLHLLLTFVTLATYRASGGWPLSYFVQAIFLPLSALWIVTALYLLGVAALQLKPIRPTNWTVPSMDLWYWMVFGLAVVSTTILIIAENTGILSGILY
jgi:hypothetical protein